jgi:hypothetical protein
MKLVEKNRFKAVQQIRRIFSPQNFAGRYAGTRGTSLLCKFHFPAKLFFFIAA